jgi:glutaredoxin
MDITIYTTSGCIFCEKIKELMRRANVEFSQVIVGKDISLPEFKALFPFAQGFPYAVIDGKEIGGLTETVKLFVEKGLVSSKKK